MADPIESWKAAAIEAMSVGERYQTDDFFACRYRDGWYFFWNAPKVPSDLGRIFDADHLAEMRAFLAGARGLGVNIEAPKDL